MRSALVLIGAAALPAAVLAQIPRDLNPILRKIPTVDSLLRGAPPLSTGFDDTVGPQPLLDAINWGTPRPVGDLERTPTGGFRLKPGVWEGTF